MSILVTGGTGYIGSHTLVELSKINKNIIVYDNLSNSSKESITKVENITGNNIAFEEGDIRDKRRLQKIFKKYNITFVIHFAGLKSVSDSIDNPLKYYDNNVIGTIRLLEVMKEFGCKRIVFSSSATVYGDPISTPISEKFPIGSTTNPYGTSKYMIERILEDLYVSDKTFKIVILRYFNPVGAHESGTIGEDPNGVPSNLMPFISQVAIGTRESLNVFGYDYNTHDGTGVRDYIHVVDLAYGHVKAIEYLEVLTENTKPLIVNLGTGKGYSVLEVVKAFEIVSGKKIPYNLVDRRYGDIGICYADSSNAKISLGWEAKKNLKDMCMDSWRWQKNNPYGYIVR